MTAQELKDKIADLEKRRNNPAISKEQKKNLIDPVIAKLKKQLAELEATERSQSPKTPKKKLVKKEVEKTKDKSTKTKVEEKKPETKATSNKKPEKKPLVKKAIETQPAPKEIKIEKDDKKESHVISTAFGKDIKDAILVLNKERYVIREKKNKETGKTEQVKHSIEYRNAKTIKDRVDKIFNSSLYDIAKTPHERKAKKEIIDEVIEIRDLTTLWLNELDIIINNEDKAAIEKLKNLMLGLLKEARKNDPDDKYKSIGGLGKLADKFGL